MLKVDEYERAVKFADSVSAHDYIYARLFSVIAAYAYKRQREEGVRVFEKAIQEILKISDHEYSLPHDLVYYLFNPLLEYQEYAKTFEFADNITKEAKKKELYFLIATSMAKLDKREAGLKLLRDLIAGGYRLKASALFLAEIGEFDESIQVACRAVNSNDPDAIDETIKIFIKLKRPERAVEAARAIDNTEVRANAYDTLIVGLGVDCPLQVIEEGIASVRVAQHPISWDFAKLLHKLGMKEQYFSILEEELMYFSARYGDPFASVTALCALIEEFSNHRKRDLASVLIERTIAKIPNRTHIKYIELCSIIAITLIKIQHFDLIEGFFEKNIFIKEFYTTHQITTQWVPNILQSLIDAKEFNLAVSLAYKYVSFISSKNVPELMFSLSMMLTKAGMDKDQKTRLGDIFTKLGPFANHDNFPAMLAVMLRAGWIDEALMAARSAQDELKKANCLTGIAEVLFEIGKVDQSADILKEALHTSLEAHPNYTSAELNECRYNIAKAYVKVGNCEKALHVVQPKFAGCGHEMMQ